MKAVYQVLLALTVVGCVGDDTPTASDNAPLERITVSRGMPFDQLTDTLIARGVITSPRWFAVVARVGRFDRAIKSGVYDLPRSAQPLAVLKTLARGKSVATRFTIPEGLTLAEVAALAESTLGIAADSVLHAGRDSSILKEFGVPASSMEGYLLPETYFIPLTANGRDLVRELAQSFQSSWDTVWTRRAQEFGLDQHALVTLASIVEGEARVADERPIIAAVYLNRLKIGMPLQADPTVQYAIQQATGSRRTRLFQRDYQFESPYNTYLIAGLPPGPIGMPGRASLRAVAFPDTVPYLFFVAADSGRHIFSRTYSEHLRAISRIRAGQR